MQHDDNENYLNRVGRPLKYSQDMVNKAKVLAEKGLINRDIASLLNIGESTMDLWLSKYPEFREALNQSRVGADTKVIKSLHKKATGFRHREEVTEYHYVDGKKVAVKTIERRKDVAPETGAISLWLRNKRPEEWSDKNTVDNAVELKLEDFFCRSLQNDDQEKEIKT